MQATILVPLDGSPIGEEALPTAMMLAQQLTARLHLVHIHQSVVLVYANDLVLGEIPTANTDLDDQCRSEEESYLGQLEAQLTNAGFMVSTALLDGKLERTLHDAASHADLVVMSTHGRTGLDRALFGNLAETLMRETSTPLLLVHVQPSDLPLLPAPPFRRVLIALDGSQRTEKVVAEAHKLGEPGQSEYTLLHILQPNSSGSQRSAAQGYLANVAHQLPAAKTVMLEHDYPALAILEYAREHNSDLVALATRGRGGLKRLILGSVAADVIHHADRPVLVYHPHDHQ